MLPNPIVRAVIGVVVAKVAVATGWYLYLKSQKDDNTTEDSPKVHDLSGALKEVEETKSKKSAIVKKDVRNVGEKVAAAVKPKRRVATKTPVQESPVIEAQVTAKTAVKKPRKSRAKAVAETPSVEVKVPVKRARKSAAKKTEGTAE